jgi:type I restriction enzyme S subunit
VTDRELPSLPSGWRWTPLGDLADVKLGKMLSPKAFAPGLAQLPYLRNENVRWFAIDTSDVKLMGFTEDERTKFRLQVGDLLVCEGGEPGRCAVVTEATAHFMIQKALHRVRPRAGALDARFLQYFFRRFIVAGTVIERRSETTIQHLPREKMLRVPVPVAPLPEQRRIVAKIEELFSDLDAGVAALLRVRANLKRYRAAAAVEGRLTEEWRARNPATEPAAKLLERILADRRAKWEQDQLRKFKEAGKTPPKGWKEKYGTPSPAKDVHASALPPSWCWATIDQLIAGDRSSAYGVLQPGEDVPDGVPLVRVCDVADGRVAIDQLKRIAPTITSRYARTVLRGGEVLLTIVGTIGRTAIVPESLRGANIARAVAVLPITYLVSARYVEMMLRDSGVRTKLTLAAHEVARKTLNLEDVRVASVPLAPLTEQSEIVAEVDRRLSVADAAEAEAERALQRAARLRQSILKLAFEGRLVQQEPSDGLAATSLQRVNAGLNGHNADVGKKHAGVIKHAKTRSRFRA